MKKCFLIATMFLLSMNAMSQENMFIIGGGYASANIEETSTKATGWKMNGNWEFNPMGGKFVHGLSFGFMNLKATEDGVKHTINSLPVYYAPKVIFGQDKLKFFVKGALGSQFAWIKREGVTTTFNDHDFGFYGGGGAGLSYFIKENVFINAEYEIAWVTNSFYKDGWVNTVGLGIGFRY